MNSKLLKGSLAGVAALALAAGGTTFAAYSDFGNINGNEVGAGILKLDLTSEDGGAAVPLDFGNLAPGMSAYKAVYVASSNGASVPDADLFMTLQQVKNFDNGCQSNSESAVDGNCASPDDGSEGDLADVLDMRIETYAAPDALTCAGYVGATGDPGPVLVPSVIPNVVGNMANPANLNVPLSLSPTALEPGDGVCVLFFTWWPANDGSYDADNAAQGDSIQFDAKFDLIQHF